VQRYIFEEECGYAGAPPLMPFGCDVRARAARFGTDAQKQRFLPRIYRGDDFWCQGYSEPARARTSRRCDRARAPRRHYVVNGQKTGPRSRHCADWIFCLVRTDARREAAGRHLVPADRHEDAGHHRAAADPHGRRHEVNEVFFDDVEVPVENLVHDEGKGWTVAKYLLGTSA
jgi:alkylation response protein AidB-like acyl-CoA dehydrogenase